MLAKALHTKRRWGITSNAPFPKDPTRTATLRKQFSAEMTKRFGRVISAVRKKLIEENFLQPERYRSPEQQPDVIPFPGTEQALIVQQQWEYRFADEKVRSFMEWLREQQRNEILEISYRPDALRLGGEVPWTNVYIQSAYQKGMIDARAELRRAGVDIPGFAGSPELLSAVFNRPFHADRVALLYTRVYSDLQGITEVAGRQMAGILARRMSEGKHPRQIAKELNDRLRVGLSRARRIARTEVIYAHSNAKLNEFEASEFIIGEEILVRWVTAGDSRVRPTHRKRNGRVYTRARARELIGEPNCRCSLAPYMESIYGDINKRRAARSGFKLAA